MIHMPRRSVTRFFIPLIDVLLLLFGIFLLMPIASESQLQGQHEEATDQTESAVKLQQALRERVRELSKLEELRPDLERVAELKQEIQLLRGLTQQALQQNLRVQVIQTDPKTGSIFYFDPTRADPLVPIPDAKAAQALIESHRKENQGRNLYYQFLRRRGAFPTFAQGQEYRAWFKDVPNSLEVQR